MLASLRGFIFSVCASLGTLASAEVWVVGSQDGFAPYNYLENGRYTGIDVEILRSAAESMGVTLEHVPTTWRRALLDFDAGRYDALFQLTPTDERFRSWHMVGPLRTTQTVFMTRADTDIEDIKALSDLEEMVLGVVASYAYAPELDNDTTIAKEVSVDDFANVRKLLLGRSDVVVGGRASLKYVVRELNAQDKVRFLPTPLVVSNRYIAFQRTPEGYTKAQRMQVELDRMRTDGVISDILESFLE